MEEIKMKRITDMNAFAAEVHENAVQHGWWNPPPPFEAVALMCITEIAEATDEYRNDMPMCYVMKKTCAECPEHPTGAHYMETDMSNEKTQVTDILAEIHLAVVEHGHIFLT